MMKKPFSSKPTFQSYIGPNGGQTQTSIEPNFIPGEVPLTSTQHVYKLMPYGREKQGVVGALTVTNFKVHFLPLEDATRGGHDAQTEQRNKLVGAEDVVLNSVDAAYSVSGGRRRKLTPQSGLTSHVKTLELHCKDFRIHRFSFKSTKKDEAKKMVTAIVHHAFPTRLDLLFAFECKVKPPHEEPAPVLPPRFDKADWERELERLKVHAFRVVECNSRFEQCSSLPEAVVVPSSLTNAHISNIAAQFVEDRWPVWTYTYNKCGSIIRFSSLIPETDRKDLDDKMLQAVRMAHPQEREPVVFDLSQRLPAIRDVQASYEKLRDMCMPVTHAGVFSNDSSWLSQLEGSGWLATVARCLQVATEVTDSLVNGTSAVLKEHDSRDMCPLVASLAQLLLDPHYRTLDGFQGLIEKEWVALGHPFTERLGLVGGGGVETGNVAGQECPTFLLFLDCVWQITQQFPSGFQFSETYLTSLWDSVCLGLFENFVFNNTRQRNSSTNRYSSYGTPVAGVAGEPPPRLLSAWDWSVQFNKEERSLFYNPLYLAYKELDLKLSDVNKLASAAGGSAAILGGNKTMILRRIYTRMLTETWEAVPEPKTSVLRPVVTAPLLRFWALCYIRWVAPLMMIGGGAPAEYLQQALLVEEIICLKHQLKSLRTQTPFVKAARPKSDLIFSHRSMTVSPSVKWRDTLTSSFPYRPTASALHTSLQLGAPVSSFATNSFILDTEDEEDDIESCEDELESSVDISLNQPGGDGTNGHDEATGAAAAAAYSLAGSVDLDSGVNHLGGGSQSGEELEMQELEADDDTAPLERNTHYRGDGGVVDPASADWDVKDLSPCVTRKSDIVGDDRMVAGSSEQTM